MKRLVAVVAAVAVLLCITVGADASRRTPKVAKPKPTPSATVTPTPTPTPTPTETPTAPCSCQPEGSAMPTPAVQVNAIWAAAVVAVAYLVMNPMMVQTVTRSQQAVTTQNCPDTTAPGAPAGASTLGPTIYNSSTTVSNVIFDGSHADDLVRINSPAHVVFDHVTFRGTGTGGFGHTLLVFGGSAEVRNSVFEGTPTEDTIQTINNGATTVECNRIGGAPGEDHVDTKDGGIVRIQNNIFTTVPPTSPVGHTLLIQNGTSPVHIFNNTGIQDVLLENEHTSGTIANNKVTNDITLFEANNILVNGNTAALIKNGQASGDRDPDGIYYLNNQATTFQMNGGSCYHTGNTGASFAACTAGPPSWY